MIDDQVATRKTKTQSDEPSIPDAIARKYLRVDGDLYRSSEEYQYSRDLHYYI